MSTFRLSISVIGHRFEGLCTIKQDCARLCQARRSKAHACREHLKYIVFLGKFIYGKVEVGYDWRW